jgi:hypothetical protein
VTWSFTDPTATVRLTGTTSTDSTGWTPGNLNMLATTPLGDWTATCSVAYNFNTGSDAEAITVSVPAGVGDTYMADPLKAFASYNPTTDKVRVAISASYLDGTARSGAASDIYVDAWNEALGQIVTAQNPTELPGTALGVYTYDFTPATDGIFTVRARTIDPDTMAAITVGNAVLVAPIPSSANYTANLTAILTDLQDHRESTIEVLMTSNFAGIGFDGFLFFVLFLALLLFFWWHEMKFAAAWTIPAIFVAMIPDFDFSLLLCVTCIVVGVGMQFFKEREKERESGVEPT